MYYGLHLMLLSLPADSNFGLCSLPRTLFYGGLHYVLFQIRRPGVSFQVESFNLVVSTDFVKFEDILRPGLRGIFYNENHCFSYASTPG